MSNNTAALLRIRLHTANYKAHRLALYEEAHAFIEAWYHTALPAHAVQLQAESQGTVGGICGFVVEWKPRTSLKAAS